MKHPGCILEFTAQRNTELMAAYRNALRQCDLIDIPSISEVVVNTPCSRYWVSEERASVVVSALFRGIPVLNGMRPLKREMFQEIFLKVKELQQSRTDDTVACLVFEVVNSPAPKFFMRPRCAMEIIYKIKNGFYDNLQQ